MVRGRSSGRSGVDPVVEISDSECHFPPRRPGQKQKDASCARHLRWIASAPHAASSGAPAPKIYRGLPLSQKLFGIGPDCLYSYLLSHPEYRSVFLNRFGMDIMNAHSILLNRLLTTGLIGMMLYLVIIVLSLRIWNRKLRSLPYIMMLLCYLAVGTVLFDQITCLPLMLILMGIGVRQE